MLRSGRSESVEDLVVKKMQSVMSAQFDQGVVTLPIEDRSRRVVREIDRDEFGIRADRGGDAVDVERPAVIGIERNAGGVADG